MRRSLGGDGGEQQVNAAEVVTYLDLPLSAEQLRACAYLERIGQRFCVEFGYANAIENARAHWRQRRNEQQRKRRARR